MSEHSIVHRKRNPDGTLTSDAGQSVPERFWSKVHKTNACWLWTAGTNNGYGQFKIDGKTYYSHRIAYEMCHGPIHEGLCIDHLCRVRHCVNPDHLEVVTHKENISRGNAPNIRNRRLGLCKNGHKISKENTVFRLSGPRAGEIAQCKICDREKRRQARVRITHMEQE